MKQSMVDYVSGTVELMKRELSDEPESLWKQVCEVEARSGYLHFILAELNSELDKAASQSLTTLNNAEGKKGNTETEKKIKIAAATTDIREWRDKTEGLISAINQRVMAGLGRLRYLRSLPMVET